MWSDSRSAGRPCADADTLIAAFASNRDALLVTDNLAHFEHLGVPLENWRE